ncbi:hypothetical protein Zmor_001232 [Zophobas morio]|uniref:Uncharacterized protein n=1 Tax=Zophobas morio TaxID=2755281 RepID=A0AA38MS46_9CUCU|nr:hypothetical protein Zmor_001232 [Zophobas morio]
MSAPLLVTRDYRARHHRCSRCAAPSCECCWIRWLPLEPRLSLGSVHKGRFRGRPGTGPRGRRTDGAEPEAAGRTAVAVAVEGAAAAGPRSRRQEAEEAVFATAKTVLVWAESAAYMHQVALR